MEYSGQDVSAGAVNPTAPMAKLQFRAELGWTAA
jgi:hypothetical protein